MTEAEFGVCGADFGRQRGWLRQWVALAGFINEGMEEGHGLARLGLTGAVGRFGRKGLAEEVGRFGRTY